MLVSVPSSFPRQYTHTNTPHTQTHTHTQDANVGAVLLSQAIVSPLTRQPGAAAAHRIASALLSASPLLMLGGVRIAGTVAADYHSHVTGTDAQKYSLE